jgi:hypothetical protein
VDRQQSLDASVVVAGLGPVAGVLAALLGVQGVSTVVIEPEEVPYPREGWRLHALWFGSGVRFEPDNVHRRGGLQPRDV